MCWRKRHQASTTATTPPRAMTGDRLALDLDAFYLEHHRCGDLNADVVDESPIAYVVWMECSCGGLIARRLSWFDQPEER